MEEHILVTLAKRQFLNAERETVHLVDEPEINAFLNDIEKYPHAYVLACLMDRRLRLKKLGRFLSTSRKRLVLSR